MADGRGLSQADGSYSQGTSFAAPRVAGYAAIIRQKFPNMTAANTASVILDTASWNARWGDKTATNMTVYGQGEASLGRALAPVGRLAAGLGEELMQRGWGVAGRETVGDFRALRFGEQVVAVADDLEDHFWREDARVVAVSFGAYLFLHAQAQLPAFPGRALLLSPIVGEATTTASACVIGGWVASHSCP